MIFFAKQKATLKIKIQNSTFVLYRKNKIESFKNNRLVLYDYDKDKGIQILRDSLSTMLYEQIEKYSTPFSREDVVGDIHFDYMDQRMFEYSKGNFRSNYCWDDELFTYKAGDIDLEDVWKDIDKVKIDKNNIGIFYELLIELNRRKKYDFRNYMNENYKKKY